MAVELFQLSKCSTCGLMIDILADEPTVHYSCGHVEHSECYFNHHPHNSVCFICNILSCFLLFK